MQQSSRLQACNSLIDSKAQHVPALLLVPKSLPIQWPPAECQAKGQLCICLDLKQVLVQMMMDKVAFLGTCCHSLDRFREKWSPSAVS